MSVYYYDEAITSDFRRILHDGRVSIIPPENTFDLMAVLKDDNVKFPMVTLNRLGWSLSNNWNHYMLHDGSTDKIYYDADNDLPALVMRMQAMPISINYQMDIWTATLQENDNIIRELMFYYRLNPTLEVHIPYGLDTFHKFNIFFEPDVADNSDIPDHPNIGRYFRQTVSFYVDDAYLFNRKDAKPTFIEGVNLFVKENMSDVIDHEKVNTDTKFIHKLNFEKEEE